MPYVQLFSWLAVPVIVLSLIIPITAPSLRISVSLLYCINTLGSGSRHLAYSHAQILFYSPHHRGVVYSVFVDLYIGSLWSIMPLLAFW